MRYLRIAFWLLTTLTLAACGAKSTWAPDADVARSVYRHDGPAAITLYTVIRKKNGTGAHSGLLVNAPSQRALFDPAGTFYHPHLPERNDVHFGMSDAAVKFYIDYHARITFDVIEQTIYVSPEVAEIALARIQRQGAVSKARCAASISSILSDIPGFESAPSTFFPKSLSKWFAKQANVRTAHFSDDSPDEKGRLVEAPSLLLN